MSLIKAFYSDPHFGHKRICEYCNRPFSSVEEMTREFIARYNSRIGTNDTVLWGGDCFFCPFTEARQIMSALNGSKMTMRGNHDRGPGTMAAMGFDVVMDQCVIDIAGQTVRVCHYPYNDARYPDRSPRQDKHELLIHGHTHSPDRVNGKMIHIGVDAWDYRPAMWEEIEEIVVRIGGRRLDRP